MAFQSGQFFVLFLSALLLYYLVPARLKNLVLLCAGVIFYAGAGTKYLLLLAVAVVLSYAAGLGVGAVRSAGVRRALFVAALVLLFGNLAMFKYYDALCAGLFQGLPALGLTAPLGVSFYTFTMSGYLIDVYQKVQQPEKNLLRYAVFVSFFPLIASGPIERGSTLLHQFDGPRPFVYENFAAGAARILWGFFKKFVVANLIAVPVDRVFADLTAYTGPYLALAALLYSYQLYCDFSGYSDIAIGVARTFGITVRENFARPFAARSFTELWRRWHMSLTGWFRTYIYFPLGGSRKGTLRTYCNTLVVFLVSGIWHGAGLTFALWGLLNGVYMVAGRLTARVRARLAGHNPLYRNRTVKAVLQIACVYLLFTSCIVLFRAQSMRDALYLYGHLFTGWGAALAAPGTVIATLKGLNIGRVFLLLCGGGAALTELVEWRAAAAKLTSGEWMQTRPAYVRLPLYYALLLLLAFYGVLGASSFIYFQF